MFCMSLLLQCCLLKFVLSIPTNSFFPNGPVASDTNVTNTETTVSVFTNIGLGCGVVRTLKVSIAGVVSLSPTGQSPSLVFKVFSVSSGDIDTRDVFYRHVPIDSTLRDRVKGDYSTNYPREPPFDPANLIVVTWKLGNDQSTSGQVIIMKDVFQLVIANGGNRSLVYYLYSMTEWAMNGNGYASVGLKSCGSTWTQTGSNTTAISNISLLQSNVDVPGKWLFLIGDEGEIIHPVKCRAQCSLTYGYCTVPDTCLCRNGWGGDICTQPLCPRGCINGNCNSPGVCTCQSGWSRYDCSVAACPDNICNKDNGACNTPNICTCNAGWNGSDCSEAICSPACVNGACIRPNTCFCANRWNGSICDNPICSSGCVNGMCNQPDVCTCNSGWTGISCETEIITDTGGSSLSGSAIGAIVGGIVGFAFLVVVIVVVVIIAAVTCC